MEEQTKTTNWLELEAESFANTFEGEKLPALKFVEESKIEEIDVDFTKPFNKYSGKDLSGKNVTKAIIPVTHEGAKKIWWLNKKNPVYQQIIKAGKAGQTKFKIIKKGFSYSILK